jgi:hypothetical protein
MASRGARRALPGHAATVDNIARVGDSFLPSDVVAFMSRKSESNTEVEAARVPGQVQRLAVFGPPLVLDGEDAAAYDELFARVCAAVKPADVIDEMLIADIVALEWEVLRWRRLKRTLMREPGVDALKLFLIGQLESNYALHEEHFKSYLTQILQDNLPPERADSAETLAAECTPNNADADDKLNQVLSSIGLNADAVLAEARADKAKEIVQEYVRAERDAVTLVNELLTDAGKSMDSFMTQVLRNRIDEIERIDRLTASAETRRNAALREIDRRRVVLGEALRRSVQKIDDDDFADGELVLEVPPAEGQNAA